MKTAFFEWSDYDDFVAKKYQIPFPEGVDLIPEEFSLEKAKGYEVISIKAFSEVSDPELEELAKTGLKMVLFRVAGFDTLNVDLATKLGVKCYRVSAYSPESIAEYAVALILNLARRMNVQREQHRTLANKRDLNSMGFLLRGKTVGLHGYGKIAQEVAKILRDGFGMKITFFDPYYKGETVDERLTDVKDLYRRNRIVSLHIPLNKETAGTINKELLSDVPANFMLINTSRGGLVNQTEIKDLLRRRMIDYLGTDVWGDEDDFDPELYRYDTFQSYHIAFFTEEAVEEMISQTLESLSGKPRPENVLPISYKK